MTTRTFESRIGAIHRRALAMFAAVVVMLAAVPTAHASTFLFVVPTATIQGALDTNIPQDTTDRYAFYQIYIRPALPADTAVGGNKVTSYAPVYDVPPIIAGNNAWTASTGYAPPSDPNIAFYYSFNPLDTVLSLVTTNVNVSNGQVIDGRTMQQMPLASTFQMFLSSASPLLPGSIRFMVVGIAYRFTDNSATAYTNKATIWRGSFDAVGTEAPEPSSLFGIAGGFLLLALLIRRRNMRKTPGTPARSRLVTN